MDDGAGVDRDPIFRRLTLSRRNFVKPASAGAALAGFGCGFTPLAWSQPAGQGGVIAKQASFVELAQGGAIAISGDPQKLVELMNLQTNLNQNFWFNIVTP